jgi:hypothetical protein
MFLKDLVHACGLEVTGSIQWSWVSSGTDIKMNAPDPQYVMDPPRAGASSSVRFCRHHVLEGGIDADWYTYRFGPFQSQGGIEFYMAPQPLIELHKAPFERIGLQALYQVLLDEDDNFVEEDTLMVHHHNFYDRYSAAYPKEWFDSVASNTSETVKASAPWTEYAASVDFRFEPATLQPGTRGEHWGVRTPEDCAFCYFQDFGSGYAKPLDRVPSGAPFLQDAYLVDLRPTNSPVFSWSYQLGFKVVDASRSDVQLLSEHQLWNPQNVMATAWGFDLSEPTCCCEHTRPARSW